MRSLAHFILILFGYSSGMKSLLLIITLIGTFFSLLPANETKDYAEVSVFINRGEESVYESNRSKTTFKDINVSFSLLKSDDKTINIHTIQKYDKIFVPVVKTETFQDANITYWFKVDLGASFPSGRFVYGYGDADFTEHTIRQSQQLEKFIFNGIHFMRFTYHQGIDPQIYYFRLTPRHFRIPARFAYVTTPETFYNHITEKSHLQFILGLMLGLIIMAGLYNAAMYYYNRDISFLYYALMQLFMSLILYSYSGAFSQDVGSFFSRNITYLNFISLFASLFATLFTLHFLELKKYLPKLNQIIRGVATVISLDMVMNMIYKSLLTEYYILPFLMLFLVYAGYKRMRQGYKPARFYLAGWVVLTIAVFLSIFGMGYEYTIIDPL